MYVSEICAAGIFVTFPWWLKNVKSRSKITVFSNERHSEIWFPEMKTITSFWSKLSKLHKKKDQISHVTATFSLKQGETRTNSVPISHPLSQIIYSDQILQYLKCWYLEMVNMDLRTSCTDIFKCLRNTLKLVILDNSGYLKVIVIPFFLHFLEHARWI